MPRYAYDGLNKLDDELSRTAVISDSFRSAIWSYVFMAIKEAYEHGKAQERE